MSLIPQLERDLVEGAGRRSSRGPLPPPGRRMAVTVAAAVLVLAGGAGAATGVLPVGSVISGKGFHEKDSRKTVRETVVATGKAPRSGPWRMTIFRADRFRGACLKVELLDPPAAARVGPRSTGYCGPLRSFDALGHGTKTIGRRRGEILLFGRAPAAARRVRLTGDGGRRVVVQAERGPAGVAGRFWMLGAPPGLSGARLEWLDWAGRTPGRPLDVSYRFEGMPGRTLVAKGDDPLAGPWRMVAYESEGSVVDGDRYEPEGLPGLELSLPDPPGAFPFRGGGTGVIRNAPGFSRGQHTLRDSRNRVLGTVMYGRAPDRADHVRIAARGGVRMEVPTREGPRGGPGRFWFLATKTTFRDGHVRWVDVDAGEVGPAVSVLPP